MNLLGSRIKELRKHKGLTQVELGNLSGIHHSNIGRIENKEVMPQADVLLLIAKNLDTSVEWLLTGQTESSKNNSEFRSVPLANIKDQSLHELSELFNQFTENEKKEVIQFAKFILYQKTLD